MKSKQNKDRLATTLDFLYKAGCLLNSRYIYPSKKSVYTKSRRCLVRKSLDNFQQKLSTKQFRRYFRMERYCFNLLVATIKDNAGEENFKSEQYIQNLESNIHTAHKKSTGGYISGEIKLALTLRLLAGGSYLDLELLFEVSFSYSYQIFHHLLDNLILTEDFMDIKGLDYIEDEASMDEVLRKFVANSQGIFSGCIGALDGWREL